MSHPKGTRPNAVGPFSVPSRGTYSNLLPTAEALRPLAEAHAKRAEIKTPEAMAARVRDALPKDVEVASMLRGTR